MADEFIRVRVPETGAHISVHPHTLAAHPGLEPLDRPTTDRPEQAKPNKSARRRAAATNTEE